VTADIIENMVLRDLALCVGAFFFGAIPWGFIAGRLRGVDLRERGSGNIGATNTLRELGAAAGVTVLILDAFKGWASVALALYLHTSPWIVVAAGLCAVLGHIYSPFVRFNGGKGVATSLGVLLGLSPLVAGGALVIFLAVVIVTRYVSLGSIVAAAGQAGLFWLLPVPLPYRLFGLLAGVFVIVRHRKNIARLQAGAESKFGTKKTDAPMENAKSVGDV